MEESRKHLEERTFSFNIKGKQDDSVGRKLVAVPHFPPLIRRKDAWTGQIREY